MELAFWVGVLAFIIYLRVREGAKKDQLEADDPDAPPPPKECPPHKWTYIKVQGIERLQCSLCKRTPGQAAGLE